MKTSPETDKIAPALVEAHKAMAPVIADTENAFLKTKYASLGAVLHTVLPSFHANGLTLIQGGEKPEGEGLLVTTRLVHVSGQWMEMSCPTPLTKKDGHGLGSAITYARRYNALAFAGVAPEDDDGNAASEVQGKDRRDKASLTAIDDKQLTEITRLLELVDAGPDNVAATARKFSEDRTEKIDGLMKSEAATLLKALRKRAKEKSTA